MPIHSVKPPIHAAADRPETTIAWINIYKCLHVEAFFPFFIKCLFHDHPSVRRAAILAIRDQRIDRAAPYLYSLFRQTESVKEKNRILEALASLQCETIAKKLLPLASSDIDEDIKIHILDIISRYPSIKQKQSIITEYASQAQKTRIKYSAILNLGIIGDFYELVRFIDSGTESERFTAFIALSSAIDYIDHCLRQIKRDPKKAEFVAGLRRNRLRIQKILTNRIRNIPQWDGETLFAYINALIDCGEKGLGHLFKELVRSRQSDIWAILDLLEHKFDKVPDKDRIWTYIMNIRFDSELVREKIAQFFLRVFISGALGVREKNEIIQYITRVFPGLIDEYRNHFSIAESGSDDISMILQFLIRFGNEEIRTAVDKYIALQNADIRELRRIAEMFYAASAGFSVNELRFFLGRIYHCNPSMRNRLRQRIRRINFDRNYIRNRMILYLEIAGLFGISALNDKMLRLRKIAVEAKDDELAFLCYRALVGIGCKPVFEEIVRQWQNNPSKQQAILKSMAISKPEWVLPVVLEWIREDRIDLSCLPIALRIIGSTAPRGHYLAIQIVRSLWPRRELRPDILYVLGKAGDIGAAKFLEKLYSEAKGQNRQEVIEDAIVDIIRESDESSPEGINILYNVFDKAGPSFKAKIIATLMIRRDDYVMKLLPEWMEKMEPPYIQSIIRDIRAYLSNKDADTRSGYLPEIRFLLRHVNRFPYIAESLAELIGIMPEPDRRRLGQWLEKEQKDQSTYEKDISPTEINEITAKKKFIERRENEKKQTIFFSDITGFTSKASKLNLLDIISLLREYEGICLPAIQKHHGKVIKKMGDGLMVAFDSAPDAVEAALSIQDRLREINSYRLDSRKIIVRIGLNTGPVYIRDGDLFGDTVNVASRMEAAAHPGTVLITKSTFSEIQSEFFCLKLAPVRVKGKTHPLECYRPVRKRLADDALIAIAGEPHITDVQGKKADIIGDAESSELEALNRFFQSGATLFSDDGHEHLVQFLHFVQRYRSVAEKGHIEKQISKMLLHYTEYFQKTPATNRHQPDDPAPTG